MDVTVDYFDTHPTILCRPIPVEKGQTAAERPRSTTFLGLTSQKHRLARPAGRAVTKQYFLVCVVVVLLALLRR